MNVNPLFASVYFMIGFFELLYCINYNYTVDFVISDTKITACRFLIKYTGRDPLKVLIRFGLYVSIVVNWFLYICAIKRLSLSP